MNYVLHLLVLLDIYFVLSLSLNIVMGYTGLLTLAHAGYFAFGSYVYALISLLLGWEFIPSSLIAILLTVLLSGMLSIASWRLRGDFFILFSLTIQVVFFTVLKNWHDPTQPVGSWGNMTNGDFGLAGIPSPSILGHEFDSRTEIAILFTAFAVGTAGLSYMLLASPWGRLLRALRDDELSARSLGKNVRLAKMQAIATSCGMAGFAGVMLASYQAFISPTSADMNEATLLFSMAIVGGVGNSVLGPFVGALLLIAIPEGLRFVDLPFSIAAELRLMVYGLMLVLLMHWRPQGVAGSYRME